jgi:small subunit ribosomal protein S2
MAIAELRELIEAGVHFGSPAARWNPKMEPYIHSKKERIHVIDLRKTLRGLIRSYHFLKQTTARGGKVLFVGTKRQASEVIRQEARRCESFFVASRWLGGTLTNMQTMRQRILRLEELEHLETSGEIHNFSKKMVATLTRERKKVARNFEGIRDMKKAPDAVVVLDPNEEHIAVAESVRLNIPIVAVLDTDCDPDPVDFVIPGNDDSMRSIQAIVSKLADGVIAGTKAATTQAAMADRAAGPRTKRDQRGGTEPAKEKEDLPEVEVPKDFSKVGGFTYGGDKEE